MSGALGILGLVGNLAGGGLEAYGASLQSHKARQFAREQSSTQYQRAVADMKAAGLNPMAIFGSGGGSPAAVAQGQFSNPYAGASRLGDEAGRAFTRGDEAAALKAQAAIAQASARQAESTADLVVAENNAYKNALNTEAGRIGAVTQRYGRIGGAGEVIGKLGVGNVLGGESNAQSTKRHEEFVEEMNRKIDEAGRRRAAPPSSGSKSPNRQYDRFGGD